MKREQSRRTRRPSAKMVRALVAAAVTTAIAGAAFAASAGANGSQAHAAAIFTVPNNSAVAGQTRTKVEAELKTLEAASTKPTKSKFAPLINSACRPPKKVAPGKLVVGWSYPGRTNTAEVEFADSTTWYLENNPDVKTVYVENGQENASTQVSEIQSLVSRGVDLIVADPATEAVSPALAQACRAGVAVIVADRSVTNGTPVTASLYADEEQDGYNGGMFIVNALHGKGNVVILGGIPGDGVTEQRDGGAELAFKTAPGIHLVAVGYTSYDPATARTLMAQYLSKYSSIQAVWGDSGLQLPGAILALKAAHRLGQVKMFAGGQVNGFLVECVKMKLPCSGSTIAMDFGMLEAQLGIDVVEGKYLPKGNVVAPLTVIPPNQVTKYAQPSLPASYWATNLIPISVIKKIFH